MPPRVLYSFAFKLGRIGIGATAWNQVQGLINAGARVRVMCAICERAVTGATRVHETFRLGPFAITHRVMGNYRATILHDWVVAKVIRRLHDEIDIVHCWPSGSLLTLRACHEVGIPTVLERPNAHTRFAFEIVRRECELLGLTLPKGHSHTYDEQRLAREEAEFEAADYLLCPSEFVARTFTEAGVSEHKLLRHVYASSRECCIKESHFHEADSGGLQLIFVGSCEPRKGLHLLLEAWTSSKASQRGRLTICGGFVDGYRVVCEPWLSHPSVQQVGFVEDVAQHMQRSHALVLPSFEEGSAIVTYEAMACGCALLVSDAAGSPCEHGTTGFVHRSGDVAALRQHIELLDQNRALLSSMKLAAATSSAELDWEHAAYRLLEVYEEAITRFGG